MEERRKPFPGSCQRQVLIRNENCLVTLRSLPDCSIDSVVTDPPYGLAFMGKRWDYDVPGVEVWAECLRVLKPGGHLLAFAGTRTQHRMAVRIEDAGFEIRDMIAWIYGSGFPKSLDVSKAIDKNAGAVREVVGFGKGRTGNSAQPNGGSTFSDDGYQWPGEFNNTAPATDAARQWDGWGTALKPALEPITVARKPLEGTVAANVQKWGTGALNVDGCRVPGKKPDTTRGASSNASSYTLGAQGRIVDDGRGRWPANLIHDGGEDVLELFPVTKSGELKGALTGGGTEHLKGKKPYKYQKSTKSEGSAARFFYCAKASKSERGPGNTHPTVKPLALMRYLVRLVTPPGGTVLDPFMGSGTTGLAAAAEGFRFVGSELDQGYFGIAEARLK